MCVSVHVHAQVVLCVSLWIDVYGKCVYSCVGIILVM